MTTRHAWRIADPSAPGPDIVPISPSDEDTDITNTINGSVVTGLRAIRSSVAGNVRVKMASGEIRNLEFTAGETRVGQFLQVRATGTNVTESAGQGLEGLI